MRWAAWCVISLSVLGLLIGCGGSNPSQHPPIRPMVEVEGRVRDALNGTGLRGAAVTVRDYPNRQDLTAVDGSFVLRMVPTGRQVILATLFGYDPAEAVVMLEPGKPFILDITMMPQLGSLVGYLFNEAHQPVGGAQVKVNGRFTAQSGIDGRFSFPELPVGMHTIVVNQPGYLPYTGTVTIEQWEYTVVEIVLVRP